MRKVEVADEVRDTLPDSFCEQFVRTAETGEVRCAKCMEFLPAGDETPVSVVVCVDADPEKRGRLTQAVLTHVTCLDSGIWEVEGLLDAHEANKKLDFRAILGRVAGLPLVIIEPNNLAMAVAGPGGDLSDSWASKMLDIGMALLMSVPREGASVPKAPGWSVHREMNDLHVEYHRADTSESMSIVVSDAEDEIDAYWSDIQELGGMVVISASSLDIPSGRVQETLQEAIHFGRATWGLAELVDA